MLWLALVIVCLGIVVAVVGGPLFHAAKDPGLEGDPLAGADVLELKASRDLKLQEIREAELDFRTGKLSEADWRAIDASLRAEAARILRELDAADAS